MESQNNESNKKFTFEMTQKQVMIVIGVIAYAWGRKHGYHYGRQTVMADLEKLNIPKY